MACLQPTSCRKQIVLWILTVALLGVLPRAAADSPMDLCRLVDFLSSRGNLSPATTVDTVAAITRVRGVEEQVLKWGRDQGIPGLEGVIPANRREAALTSVYETMAAKYMSTVALPDSAPDVGVKVTPGEPHVVMFAPEGKVNDRIESIAKIGYERWGHHMVPQFYGLRDGRLLIRVFVGGEGYSPASPHRRFRASSAGGPRYFLDYLSEDGGRHWLHFASFHQAESMENFNTG